MSQKGICYMKRMVIENLEEIEDRKLEPQMIIVDTTYNNDIDKIINSIDKIFNNNQGIIVTFKPISWWEDNKYNLSREEIYQKIFEFYQFNDEIVNRIYSDESDEEYEDEEAEYEEDGNQIYNNYLYYAEEMRYPVLKDVFVNIEATSYALSTLYEIANDIKEMGLSPFEQIFACYVIAEKWFKCEDKYPKGANTYFTALFYESVVCTGISDIFYRLLNEQKIECHRVAHDFENLLHMRNKAYINDDKYGIKGWYYFDATLDRDRYNKDMQDDYTNASSISLFGLSNNETQGLIMKRENAKEQLDRFYDSSISTISITDEQFTECLYNVYKKIYNGSVSPDTIKMWIKHSIEKRHFYLDKTNEIVSAQNKELKNSVLTKK